MPFNPSNTVYSGSAVSDFSQETDNTAQPRVNDKNKPEKNDRVFILFIIGFEIKFNTSMSLHPIGKLIINFHTFKLYRCRPTSLRRYFLVRPAIGNIPEQAITDRSKTSRTAHFTG